MGIPDLGVADYSEYKNKGGPVLEPYFHLDGNKVVASQHTAGPWDPTMQHGGAPTALIAHIADTIPSDVPMMISRLTIDMKRPIPVGELDIKTEVTRKGRNILAADISLWSGEKEVCRGAILKIREAEFELPETVRPPEVYYPPGDTKHDVVRFKGFNDGVEIFDALDKPAHARRAAWFHISRPFFGDQDTTPIMRAAATGDYCNGFGSGLDFNKWTFINADLTIHLARKPEGERIMLAANAWIGPDGRGLGYGELADERGFFGRATQCLVIGKR